MSTMDGLTDVTQAFQMAKRWGHRALAITDHGVVQAFPEAAKAAKKTGVKAIFGVEGYLLPDCELIDISETYVVFDIETTGLKPEHADIIEIGAVKISGGVVVDRFQTFINDGVLIPSNITELTGIDSEMLVGAPPAREVLQRFASFPADAALWRTMPVSTSGLSGIMARDMASPFQRRMRIRCCSPAIWRMTCQTTSSIRCAHTLG